MRNLCALLAVAVFLGALPAFAAGDDPAGKAEMCQACHGVDGVSQTPGVPSLAGQPNQFLQWQLVFFRSGRRQNELMAPMAANLSDEDVRALGAYFAALQPPAATQAADENPALSEAGRALTEQHRCAACHTDAFTGKRAAARLAHQHEEYLAKALADYRSGARPSTGVAAMTEAASTLSDAEIAAIAHYLARLP